MYPLLIHAHPLTDVKAMIRFSRLTLEIYHDYDVVECLNEAVNDLSINELDDSITRELDDFEASNV